MHLLLRRLSLLCALAWMALLFYLSHQSSLHAPQLFSGQDKLIHAVAYGVLASCILMALQLPQTGYTRRQVNAAALLASLYGISDEFHQAFIPGRSAEVLDWVADSLGALLAALLLAQLSRVLLTARRAHGSAGQ